MLQVLLIILLFAALGMLWKASQTIRSKGWKGGPAVTAGLSLAAVLGGTGLLLAPTLFPAPDSLGTDDLNRLQAAQAWMVLRGLPPDLREKKVVFLVRETELDSDRTKKMLAAAREAVGGNADISAVPVTPAAAQRHSADDAPPFPVLVRAADYDRALTGCGDAGTVVFAAELPRDSGAMRFWKRSRLPQTYILNAATPLDEALKRNLIAGYTILNEKADFENRSIPGEYEAAFASRYRLVTAAN